MQAKVVEQQGSSARIAVTIPAAEVSTVYARVLADISRQIRIPGFRPGKAPRSVIIQRIGEDALNQEVRDFLVDSYFPKAINQLGLTVINADFIREEASEGQDYSFEAQLDLYPEISLPDLSEIVIDTVKTTVTDDMIEETVASLQSRHATLVPVERPVEAGDYLMLQTGNMDEQDEASRIPIDLESVDPEFAEEFLGKNIGDEIELKNKASGDEDGSEEDPEEDADNSPVSLRVRILDIKAKEKPELNDDFAQTLGFDSWEATLGAIRQTLQNDLDNQTMQAQQDEFIDKLLAETDFDLPPSLVERRKESMLKNLESELEENNTNLKDYLKKLAEDGKHEDFNNELQESAERAVKRDLVLERLLIERGSQLSDQDFEMSLRYNAMQQGMDLKRFKKEMGETWLDNYRFLLTRNRAVRETVQELLNADSPETVAEAVASEASTLVETAEEAVPSASAESQEDVAES